MEENATTQENTTTTIETVEVPSNASFFDSENLSTVLSISLGAILLLVVVLGFLVAGKRRRESMELASFEDDGRPASVSDHEDDSLALDEDEVKKK